MWCRAKIFPLGLPCLLFLFFIIDVKLERIGLYDSDKDYVIILNDISFNSLVNGTNQTWVIHFYNEWCGHCIKYVPTWLKLSEQLSRIDSVLNVGVVNCVTSSAVCSAQGIYQTPYVRYFRPFLAKGAVGEEIFISNLEEAEEMVSVVVNKTLKDVKKMNISKEFQPTNLQTLKKISKAYPSAKHIFIMFENDDPLYFNLLALEFHAVKNIEIIYASLSNRRLVGNVEAVSSGIVTQRSMVHLSSTKKELLNIDNENGIVPYSNIIRKIVGLKKFSVKTEEKQVEKKKINLAQAIDHMSIVDLRNALTYSMVHEIPLHQQIGGEKMEALKKLYRILDAYFPGTEPEKKVISSLSKFLDGKNKISKREWVRSLKIARGKGKLFTKVGEWSNCKGTESQYRGYPCGLWTIFHYIVTQDYITNRNNANFKPMETIKIIHDYVKYFFGCKECSTHFQAMVRSTLNNEVHIGNDGVMWFWRSHNKVNKRLTGAVNEDPSHLKIQFPSKSLCPKCWNGDQLDDDSVFKFLLKFYNKEIILEQLATSREPIKQEDRSAVVKVEVNPKHHMKEDQDTLKQFQDKSQFNFKQVFGFLDVGLCLSLYVAMIVIVIAFYVIFLFRKKKKRSFKKNKYFAPV